MAARSKTTVVWPPCPPSDETEEERVERLAQEAEAKRVSDSIDQEISAEREQRRRSSNAKILLLGQAESGKSTVLKNFQLHFAPKAFQAEADIWRPVIYLNLVRSVNFVLNVLSLRYPSLRESSAHQPSYGSLNSDLRRLCVRLAPLRQVEESLTQNISGSSLPAPANASDTTRYNPAQASEASLRSGTGWKGLMNMKLRRQSECSSIRSDKSAVQNRRILGACADDIIALWQDPGVQKTLKEQEIMLYEQPGFFLEDVKRITRDDYTPTSADILRARFHTIGPEEHHIHMETHMENTKEWTIYDVGGSRSQRAAWAQFFDDVNMIVFLAPISAFNQTLAEDESVNRLTDTLKLWQIICSNKLLSTVEFILFLNKLDILDTKLKEGIQFSEYVTSYKGKPNETKPVAKYLLEVFASLHQQHSLKKRKLHPHLTCAIDTRATASVINQIQEVILVKILSQTNIL